MNDQISELINPKALCMVRSLIDNRPDYFMQGEISGEIPWVPCLKACLNYVDRSEY